MHAVMRPADARFSASAITMISIRLSLVGAHVDCSMKTSRPRTFSSSSTITSPSENLPTTQRPRLMLRCRHTASASFGFALPVNTLIRSKAIAAPSLVRRALRAEDGVRRSGEEGAGEEGFEPSNAGIKIRCLNQLGDSPAEITGAPTTERSAVHPAWDLVRRSREGRERVARKALRDEAAHARRPRQDGALRLLARCKRREHRTPRSRHPRMRRALAQFGQGRLNLRVTRARHGLEIVAAITLGKDVHFRRRRVACQFRCGEN